jgi:hypothetical protein
MIRDRWQLQFDNLARKIPTPTPKPLTGIEKEQIESAEAREFWSAIRLAEDKFNQ